MSESKKPYTPPILTEYGSVAKLTQAKSGGAADGRERKQKVVKDKDKGK